MRIFILQIRSAKYFHVVYNIIFLHLERYTYSRREKENAKSLKQSLIGEISYSIAIPVNNIC